jgi:hypothetical protein
VVDERPFVKGLGRRTKKAALANTRAPRFLGAYGCVIGMRTFGGLAHLMGMEKKSGFEQEKVLETAKELLGKE